MMTMPIAMQITAGITNARIKVKGQWQQWVFKPKYDNSPIHITTAMTGKLKGFWSINSNPLSNTFCQKMRKCSGKICAECFRCKMLTTVYENCIGPFEHNSRILSADILPDELLPRFHRLFPYIRLDAHGEIVNEIYFINMCNLARFNPDHYFTLWTKRTDIVQKHKDKIPANLTMIYSNPDINDTTREIPDGFDKIFTVFSEDYIQENDIKINCGAKSCKKCMLCYGNRDKARINEVLKTAGNGKGKK